MQLYVRELVQRLPRVAPDLQFVVVSNAAFDVQLDNVRLIPLSEAQAVNGGLAEQFGLPRRLAASRPSLVHFMSVYAPRRSRLPHVYTIHDLIHLRFPQYFSWKVPPYYRWVVKPVATSASRVITDATATIVDLQRYLAVKRELVRVVPLASADDFYLSDGERSMRAAQARARFTLQRPYFLYAGNHRPHKNLNVLIQAWQSVPRACDLVITEDGTLNLSTDTALEKRNGRLVLTGRVSRAELIDLYAGCAAAVQPSLYEGFGLAVLEAMAAGAPAIVASTPALLELGDQAVLSFAATDAGSLSMLMQRVHDDPALQERLRAAGQKRAQDFSWDATARQTASVYREALEVHAKTL